MATMKKLTPVLVVDAIEPVLPFWERLGFEKRMEVPHGDRLGFVGLASGAVEIMYQTVESVRADVPTMAEQGATTSFLFIEVEDLDAVERARGGDAGRATTEDVLRSGRADRARSRRQWDHLRAVRGGMTARG